MKVFAGVDIGGTNVKLVLLDRRARIIARNMMKTDPARGPRHVFTRARAQLLEMAGGNQIESAGVGCAGLIDVERGRLLDSPNLTSWENIELARIAGTALGVYTTIDNDANSAAYGEMICGGTGRNIVFITLGTGVGGGIICDGKVLRGSANFAGELGHMAVEPDGARCRCGTRGCLEAYLGSYGLVRTARRLLADRSSRHLPRMLAQGRKLNPSLLAEAAQAGDAVARLVFRDAGKRLGVAVASLVNIFNPDAVVLGGGVAAAFDLFAPALKTTVGKRAFKEPARRARIVVSSLGNEASAVGAALYARDHLNSP